MKLNYGLLISQIIRLEGHTIHSVSKHLNVEKELLQEWLKEESVSLVLVEKIGTVIVHDFSKDFPELFDKTAEEVRDNMIVPQTSGYRDKYIQLLETYNARLINLIRKCRDENGDSCCR